MAAVVAPLGSERKSMFKIQATLFLSDPRKVALLLSLVLFALALAGCNSIPACPSGSSGGTGGCAVGD